MNYVKVELSGHEYPVSFGMMALAKFCKDQNLSLSEMNAQLQNNLDIMSALKLIYFGLEDGARKAKQEFNLTLEDVADRIDEDPDAIERFFAEFQALQPQKKEAPGKPKAKAKR